MSSTIGAMPVLWLDVPDRGARAQIEQGLIATLAAGAATDPPSPGWLGLHANREPIRRSGLWNVQHVGRPPEAAALEAFDDHVREIR